MIERRPRVRGSGRRRVRASEEFSIDFDEDVMLRNMQAPSVDEYSPEPNSSPKPRGKVSEIYPLPELLTSAPFQKLAEAPPSLQRRAENPPPGDKPVPKSAPALSLFLQRRHDPQLRQSTLLKASQTLAQNSQVPAIFQRSSDQFSPPQTAVQHTFSPNTTHDSYISLIHPSSQANTPFNPKTRVLPPDASPTPQSGFSNRNLITSYESDVEPDLDPVQDYNDNYTGEVHEENELNTRGDLAQLAKAQQRRRSSVYNRSIPSPVGTYAVNVPPRTGEPLAIPDTIQMDRTNERKLPGPIELLSYLAQHFKPHPSGDPDDDRFHDQFRQRLVLYLNALQDSHDTVRNLARKVMFHTKMKSERRKALFETRQKFQAVRTRINKVEKRSSELKQQIKHAKTLTEIKASLTEAIANPARPATLDKILEINDLIDTATSVLNTLSGINANLARINNALDKQG